MKRSFILLIFVLVLLSTTSVQAASYDSEYIHNITPFARYIYQTGKEVGNNPYVLAKVGDSITYAHEYLWPIGEGRYTLNEYDYLQNTINLWGESFTRDSITAISGFTLWNLLEPYEDFPTRLDAEYQSTRPSVAFIMIGTNDLVVTNDLNDLEGRLRRVLNITLYYNVVPVLSTIPERDGYDVTGYNEMVIDLAEEYQIPYIDYYSLMQTLPNLGLCSDGTHPSSPDDGQVAYFDEWHLSFGYTARNLLTLQLLYELEREVIH